MDEWHRIEDGLPEAGEHVLGWHVDEAEVYIVYRTDGNVDGTGRWQIVDSSGPEMHVSHWLPLPAPPRRWGAPVW